jgi:two-component system CheB/CheR fusion protein
MTVIIDSIISPVTQVAARTNGHHARRAPAIVLPLLAPDPRADEIATIAHELRNSLSVVRNAARLLRTPAGANGVEGARILIERHVGQMTRHIEDLLEASHQDAHKKVLRRTHIDLRTIVEFAVSAIAPDLARRGHRLVLSLPADPLWVEADASRMEQVFSNLLINAAKYTPDGGDIILTMESLDKRASIVIRDSGIGIEPAVLLRVFDMFAQADAAAICAEGGSGIGLAVVRDLVEMHGGTVRAASAGLGLGSEFTVLLPSVWSRVEVIETRPEAQ